MTVAEKSKTHLAAKKAWDTMRQEELRQFTIVILRKNPEWASQSSFFGDDPTDAATFMWGRIEPNYQLFIRGREYKWAAQRGDAHLIKHLEYCIQFDREFYKEPEPDFPKSEIFVTKNPLQSAEK